MSDSVEKYHELVEAGKIEADGIIKRIPLFTSEQVTQIAYEVGLWSIDIERLSALRNKPSEVLFKERFDKWIVERLKLNRI